jgi:hypothetical protein
VTGEEMTTATAPPVRYGTVLLLILASVAAPFLVPGDTAGATAVALLQAATVVAALRASGVPRRVVRLTLVGLGLAVVLVVGAGVVEALRGYEAPLQTDAARIIGIVLALYVPVLIVRDLALRHFTIDLQTVWAALCLYLLLGLAFASIHLMVDRAAPGSYSRELDQVTAVYFAYIAMTTVGFGDITPVRPPAQAVTVLQAVLGQLYLVSVVAAIVGNLGRVREPHEPRPRRDRRQAPPPREHGDR